MEVEGIAVAKVERRLVYTASWVPVDIWAERSVLIDLSRRGWRYRFFFRARLAALWGNQLQIERPGHVGNRLATCRCRLRKREFFLRCLHERIGAGNTVHILITQVVVFDTNGAVRAPEATYAFRRMSNPPFTESNAGTMRCYAIIGVIAVLLIYCASVSLCGFNFHHCKAGKN